MEKSTIMRNAHARTAATVRRYPEADYSATLTAALVNAWEEADGPRSAWEAMDGEKQLDALRRMVLYARRREEAETASDGSPRRNRLAWIKDADDVSACAAEAYIRLAAMLDAADESDDPAPLSVLLFRAVIAAGRYINRQERRSARALRVEDLIGPDGEPLPREYIIDGAAPLAERIAPGPEEAAIIREAIEAAIGADDTDKALAAALAAGYSIRQAAAAIGLGHSAAAARVKRMRERYSAAK